MALDRAVPIHRDHRVQIGSLPTATTADIAKASEILTQKVTRGQISVEEGEKFSGMLE